MIVDLFFLNRVSKGTVSENKLGHVKIVPEVIESFSPQNDNTKYIDVFSKLGPWLKPYSIYR